MKVYFSIQYALQFQFKDNKVKIDAPVVTRLFTDENPNISFSGWLKTQKIFKKGVPNPKKQETIDGFNNALNDLINQIASINNNVNEDW